MGTHKFVIEGTEYQVEVGPRAGNTVSVTVNGKPYEVEVEGPTESASLTPASPESHAPAPAPRAPAAMAARTAAGGGSGNIVAPISGVVLRVAVKAGQTVKVGTLLLVLEAMKMENEIFAPIDGTVASVDAQAQQEVRQGDPLVTIKPS